MTEQMNVPKLRFGEFAGIWLSDRVGNVFDIKAGGDIDKENVSDVRNEKFPYPVFANAEKKKGLYGYSDLYKVDPPCLTVAGRGVNIGIAHARFERFYPIVRLLTLKPKKEQDVKFHEYVFNRLNIFVESTGVPQLTGPQISSYRVALPAHPEQQKIASFLSKVDQKIGLLTEKKDKLTEYKKGVMQQLFNGKWEEQDGQLTFIPPTLRFKADDGNEFPDWEEKKLGDVLIKYRLGGNYQNSEVRTQFPLIKMGNLGRGNINLNKVEYILEGEAIDSQDRIKEGDLFFNTRNTLELVGKVAIWKNELAEAYYNSNLMRLEFDNNYFMNYCLNSFNGIRGLRRFATGTTSVAAIYTRDLLKLKLCIPILEEQTKISDFLTVVDQKIDLTNLELEKAKEWKKGLLQQMFV